MNYARTKQEGSVLEMRCLECLASPYVEGKERIVERVPGTCEWFLRNSKFVDWQLNDKPNLLWVSADPGCGKSVLSRALMDEGHLTVDARKMSICYYFFSYDNDDQQSSAKARCAILHQLFTQKPVLLKYATAHFENHDLKFCTQFSLLWDILVTAAADREAGEIGCV